MEATWNGSIFVPRYASEKRPNGLVPPSPPAEGRQRRRRLLERAVRSEASYTGRLEFPTRTGRLWRGRLEDFLHAMRIGSPGSLTGGFQSLSGVETQLLGANSLTLPSPSHFWTLGDASNGNRADNGTVGTWTLADKNTNISQVAGHLGNAADFTTIDQALTLASMDAPGVDGAWTYSLWAYVHAYLNSDSGFLETWGANAAFPSIALRVNRTVDSKPQVNNTSSEASWSAQLPLTTWVMVSCGFDPVSTQVWISVNGATRVVGTGAGGQPTQVGLKFYMGWLNGWDADSVMDAVMFDLTAWSDAQLLTLYNGGTGSEWDGTKWPT